MARLFTAGQRKIIVRILLNILVLVSGAIFVTWFLEYRYFMHDANEAWNFVFDRPRVFLFNAFLVLLTLGVLYMMSWRSFTAISVSWAFIIIVTYIHINKFASRGTPLLPEDFQLADQAGALVGFIDIWSLVRMILATIIVLVIGGFLDQKTSRWLKIEIPGNLPFWLKKLWIPRVAIAVILAGIFMVSTDFIRNHAGTAYERIDFLNTKLTAWNQNRNYDENGFILGFLYNWKKVSLEEPEDYSAEKISEIWSRYEEKRTVDVARKSLSDSGYNLVIILDESFYDPELLKEYYHITGGDVTPNWHKIAKKYPSGFMYSTDYGGGTANIEYEVFTGLTNFWADTVPYTDIFPKLKSVPSIASYAKKNGYKATALHPYNGGMYKRNIALKVEGYDEFLDVLSFDFTEHDDDSQYVNDKSAYAQTLKTLREKEGPQMIELVTMQNHLPYHYDNYYTHDFTVTDVDDQNNREAIETYLQSLHNSDKYLGEFLAELDNYEEPTVVLFFGDHSPGVFARANTSDDARVRNLTQLTPYFIYTNFDYNYAGVNYGAAENLPAKIKKMSLPTTTPNCLANTLSNTLNLKKPTLGYLLDDVCKTEPILSARYLDNVNSDQVISDYGLVVYDILGGSQFWK